MNASEKTALPTSSISYNEWSEKASKQLARAKQWTTPIRQRRASGKIHPIFDFLFTYYTFSCAQLEYWHPGKSILLEGAKLSHNFGEKSYSTCSGGSYLDYTKFNTKARYRAKWCLDLCRAIENRLPKFGCFGLHEWAMVYNGGPEGRPRHEGVLPLRLSQSETNAVVEKHPIRCSHFDAFRFFTPSAMPLNQLQPTLETRPENEQAGCLHSNMDLYKWTAKAMPWVGSDLLWDTFIYAVRCRELDMKASPYDCTSLGYTPIEIENETGRAIYKAEQKQLSEDSKALRSRLIKGLETLLLRSEKLNNHSL